MYPLRVKPDFFIIFQHPISLGLKRLFYSICWRTNNFIWMKPTMKAKVKREREKKSIIMLEKLDTQKSANITKLFVESLFGFFTCIYEMIWSLAK